MAEPLLSPREWTDRWTTLRTQVQQARDTYYSYALDAGEHAGRERQEALYYARVEVCDEVLGMLAGTPAPGEGDQ